MADRVHPRYSPPTTDTETITPDSSGEFSIHQRYQHPSAKPTPPPGTYVVQIPKDQVFRLPPPENARRLEQLSRRKPRRGRCCCCLCALLAVLATVIAIAGIAAAVLYLVFRPKVLDYSIDKVAIRGFNLTSSTSPISPEFDVTVRAENPNKKIGVYYLDGSSVNVYYNEDRLSTGALPVFYQPSKNVTVFVTVLRDSGIVLTSSARKALADEQKKKTVPFKVGMKVPVKIKVGSVKTWKITVKVKCDVTVDKLTAFAKIVSQDCDYSVKLW
ncbi:protein YLS9-like [Tripterygium wilfordii]|uniref:Protein YLS9-like n=1 Tax=Tripterygium wilfordii TaxID=458696 RepID=A0A7J7C0A6_TRIWF|nr:NDR1/HIN1-like protein 13 [Tripterygium wilfordii]KAF5727564.1 protein YLS9-like [Tripterygium wilfordii]